MSSDQERPSVCRLTFVISSASTSGANSEEASQSSELTAQVQGLTSEVKYFPENGTVDTEGMQMYNGTVKIVNEAASKLHAQLATSLFQFRSVDGTQHVNLASKQASESATTGASAHTYQSIVQHAVTTTKIGATQYTRVTSTAYLTPTNASVAANNGSIPYTPAGYKSVKLLHANGTLAASSVEGVFELYTSAAVGQDADVIRMRSTVVAGDPALTSSLSRSAGSNGLSPSKLYPDGGFAKYRASVQERYDGFKPTTIPGSRANPSTSSVQPLVDDFRARGSSKSLDYANTTELEFLNDSDCVESDYLTAEQNLCYNALGKAMVKREILIDSVAKTRSTNLQATLSMSLGATVFGSYTSVAMYGLSISAGYTKSSTGLTVSAGYHHILTAFPYSKFEAVLFDQGDSWATDFSARCEDVAPSRFDDTDNSVWGSAIDIQTPSLNLMNLLPVQIMGMGMIGVTLSASIKVRYAITPCTNSDGNYALLIGLSYQSGITASGSIKASLLVAYGGATVTSNIVQQKSSVILAWPIDDVLQLRDLTPACTLASNIVEGLQVESYWWWQAKSTALGCLLSFGTCPGSYALQYMVGYGDYECCTGDSREIWNRPASVWVNDDAGWQCSASRYLNVGQSNYVTPSALCEKSQTLSATEGTITSDKAATSALELREYHPNTDCQWTLPILPEGSKVILDVDFVDLEGPFDRLQVFNGANLETTITGSSNQNSATSQPYTVYTKVDTPLRLQFASDASIRQRGFVIRYSTEAPPSSNDNTQTGSSSAYYDVTFGLGITGITTSDISTAGSPAQRAITSAVSTTLAVPPNKVQLSTTAMTRHRSLLALPSSNSHNKAKPSIGRLLLESPAVAWVKISGVSREQSLKIHFLMQDSKTLDKLEESIATSGIPCTVTLPHAPKTVKSSLPSVLDIWVNIPQKAPVGPIAGAVSGAVLLAAITAFTIYKRRQRRITAANANQAQAATQEVTEHSNNLGAQVGDWATPCPPDNHSTSTGSKPMQSLPATAGLPSGKVAAALSNPGTCAEAGTPASPSATAHVPPQVVGGYPSPPLSVLQYRSCSAPTVLNAYQPASLGDAPEYAGTPMLPNMPTASLGDHENQQVDRSGEQDKPAWPSIAVQHNQKHT